MTGRARCWWALLLLNAGALVALAALNTTPLTAPLVAFYGVLVALAGLLSER